jgi:nucleoside-diphosphate-sugar epimerase
MKTALVTGATGMLGRAIMLRLLGEGHAVRALVRETSDVSIFTNRPVTLCTGSAGDYPALQEAVAGVDWVFHAAGYVSREAPFTAAGKAPLPEPYRRINVQFTKDLLAFSQAAGVQRFIFASSASVYGLNVPIPTPEEALTRPGSHYGRSKLMAENVIQQGRVPFTIIRPAVIYGPGDRHFLPSVLQLARLPVVMLVNGGNTLLDCIYVDDVAALMVTAAANAGAAGHIYNAGSGEATSLIDLLAAYQKVTGRRPRVIPLPAGGLRSFVRVTGPLLRPLLASLSAETTSLLTPHGIDMLTNNYYLDMSRAAEALDFRPVYSLTAGLQAYFANVQVDPQSSE